MDHQCNCGTTHNEGELGVQYNLYTKIDTNNVECLNEYEEGSGVTVFKPWEDRLNHDKYVESDVDDEFLFNIPFTGNVKLKGLIIIGGSDDSYSRDYLVPKVFAVQFSRFKNRPHMTFDEVATEPDQEFELCKDYQGFHQYPIKVVKFSSVHHLTLHFSGNSGAERTRINYIGLKGEWTPGHRHGVTICTYESRPMISEHATDLNPVNREIQ